MKQKDIILIGVVVIISAVVSFMLSNVLFGSPKKNQQEVEVVQAITADFPTPDKKYFNDQSIDPTQLIQIGPGENPNPFGSQAQ